jgi:hypothetical protein
MAEFEEKLNELRFIAFYMILSDADFGNRIAVPLVTALATIYSEEITYPKLCEFMESIGYKKFQSHICQILSSVNIKDDGTCDDCDSIDSDVDIPGENNKIDVKAE